VAGVLSPPLAAAARSLGLVPVTWTARAYDGHGAVPYRVAPARALARLARGVVDGGILLAHDNPGSPGPEIVPALRALADQAGLHFVTLSALLTPAVAPDPASHPALPNLSISQRDLTSPSP
jgi:hypothetical protein